MKNAKTIALVVLVVCAAIVVLQNTESVETKLLFFTLKMPRAILLFVTLLIGFALGLVARGRIHREAVKHVPAES